MWLRSSWLVLSLVACAGRPIASCPPKSDQKPAPSAECLHGLEGLDYTTQLAAVVADELMGRRRRGAFSNGGSHAGHATLSVEFSDDSRAASVCVRQSSGETVRRRVTRAAARVHELPAAPACFAGRRVDFAWESPALTDEDARRAKAECRKESAEVKRSIAFCRQTNACDRESVRRLWEEADDRLASCWLQRVPVTLWVAGTKEPISFLPIAGVEPSRGEALRAFDECDGSPGRTAVVDCMFAHGWRPVE